MNEETLLRLADLSLAESYREMARWHTHTEILEQGSMLLTCGPDSFPALSFAMRTGPEARPSPDDFLRIATAFFRERRRAFSIRLRSHADADLAEVCEARGVRRVGDSPGMVLEGALPDAVAAAGVELRIVNDSQSAADFGRVAAAAYETAGLRKESAALQFGVPERLLEPHLFAVVAYLGRAPSACAITLLGHGIAGVYWVGTAPDARRRGLAELCTRAVGNEAFARGARRVVLQASAEGESLYRAMGYREFTRYPWYLCATR
jgi:ribosomal protein S18 acetylase RimI-like enzyme